MLKAKIGVGVAIWLCCAGLIGCSFGSKDPQPDGGPDGQDGADGGPCEPGVGPAGRTLCPETLLGEGGFFGVSGTGQMDVLPGGAFAVGAHYADLNDGQDPAYPAGRVYLFAADSLPTSVDQAALVLQPTDEAEQGGFGYAIGNACDLDGDGALELPVGNHLYTPPGTQLYASGRAAVFRGAAGGLAPDRVDYLYLSGDLRARSDAMGQTVICADADGDGQADLLLGGQNAGAANTGLVAVFAGGPDGPGTTQDWIIEPPLRQDKQYFGASGLVADLDLDGQADLALGGWGLVKDQQAGRPHTGGVLVYPGGTDWSAGPAYGLYPAADDPIQAGAVLALAGDPVRFLVVGAPDWGSTGPDDFNQPGAVLLYRLGPDLSDGQIAQTIVAPPGYQGGGFGQSVAWVPDYHGPGEGALLVGMKYADAAVDNTGTGVVAVYSLEDDGQAFDERPAILVGPDPVGNDAFGGRIVYLGDLDGDGLGDFFVGMESHVEGDPFGGGVQTGGVVFYH